MDVSREDAREAFHRLMRDARARGRDMRDAAPGGAAAGAIALGIAAIGGYVAYRALSGSKERHGDDAPWASAKDSSAGVVSGEETIQRSVTIDATPQEIRKAARDNASALFGGTSAVRWEGDALTVGNSTYRFSGEGEERRFTLDGDDSTHGMVRMAAAPGKRGTTVSVALTHRPLGGKVGNAARGLAQKDAKTRIGHSLKRLKMLVEAGEVADAANLRADAKIKNGEA